MRTGASARVLLLLAQRFDRADGLRGQSLEDGRGLRHRGLHHAGDLRQENLAALEVGELVDFLSRERGTVEVPALDDEKRVCLGEGAQTLRDGDRVTVHESDRRRALE